MKQNDAKPNRGKAVRRGILGALILLFGVAIGGTLLVLGILYFGLRPYVVWEYGAGIPEISAFAPDRAASYVDLLPQKPEIGLHTVRIEVNGIMRIVFLEIRDTTAPTARGLERTVSTKAALKPTDLIEKLTDADKVWVDFEEKPPFGTVGDYSVTIVMEDVSGNRSEVDSALHIRLVREEGITIEAGEPMPKPGAFLTDTYDASYATEITEQMLHTPGVYEIEILADGMRCASTLTVVDTQAPVLKTGMLLREPGETVLPEDFCEQITDGSEVTVSYLVAPDPDSRDFQQVTIRATDAAGNYKDADVGLLFTHAQPIVAEARRTPMTAAECLAEGSYTDAVLVREFIPDEPGLYAVTLYVDGAPELALVEVRDTVAPIVEASDYEWYLNHPLEASQLCTVTDATETSVVFTSEVDWTLPEQTVSILVTDAAQNETSVSLRLTLIEDTVAPVLYGIKSRYFYLDEPYAYLTGVAAVDNADGEIAVSVDTSDVPQNRTGSYMVRYSATDSSGNTVSARATVTIKKSDVSVEKLDLYVKKVTGKIFKENMTLAEKVFAVYDYVNTNVRYVSKSDKTDWRKEALRGLKNGKGDCFTSNAVARALLEAAGAEVVNVQRHSYNRNHYWLLVNIGTGWYHFDATDSREHGYRCCMWTDAQCSVMSGFWVYEKNTVPAVATEPFNRKQAEAVEEEWLRSHNVGA